MVSEKIDIHGLKEKYERALKILEKDKNILPRNRELILKFLKDAELGKTVKNREKKKISPGRCLKFLVFLRKVSKWLDKDFDKVTQEDMERLILEIEKDKIQTIKGKPFTESTKVDIKKIIKKFYKWLLGNNSNYPEIVDWIDTYSKVSEVPALMRCEVEKIIEHAKSTRDKALIMLLFDSGARPEEFLNLRLEDIKIRKENLKELQPHNTELGEKDYYLIRIRFSKTKPRTISVVMCTKSLKNWLLEHPERNNPQAQLFPMDYGAMKMVLHRAAKKALNKSVYPYLLRHSSVTYYCNKLTQYQLCYRYGWSMASAQPARYIDREGIHEQETAKIIKTDEISRIHEENQTLKEDVTRLVSEQKEMWNLLGKISTVINITSEATNKNRAVMETKLKEQIREMSPKGKIVYSLKE
jgi:site-specific recombinase XerD